MHSMRRCSENGDGIRLLWFLAAACCLFLAGEGRVHLATPARVHHFKLTKAVETASLGLAGDGSRRRAETLMYRGEAKPWDEVGMHSDEVPDWMNGVNARARQLEAAAAAEREGLPRMGGLGLRLRDDWKVTGMIRGGAAAMLKETCPVCSSGAVAGVDADECRCIRKGDVLMEVDGVSVQGLDVQEASVILVGPNRSEVSLTVARDKNKLHNVTLRRRLPPHEYHTGKEEEYIFSSDEEPERPVMPVKGMFGVGMTLGEGLEVMSVEPAISWADLKVGDKLVSVDGVRVKGMPSKKAARLLSGRAGTMASLLLTRKRELIAVSLPRIAAGRDMPKSPPAYDSKDDCASLKVEPKSSTFGGITEMLGLGSWMKKRR